MLAERTDKIGRQRISFVFVTADGAAPHRLAAVGRCRRRLRLDMGVIIGVGGGGRIVQHLHIGHRRDKHRVGVQLDHVGDPRRDKRIGALGHDGGAVVSTLPAVEVREFIGASSRLESKPLKQRKRRFFGQNRNGELTALLDHIVGEILLVDGDADTVGVVGHLNGGVDDAGVIAFAVIGGQHEQTVG